MRSVPLIERRAEVGQLAEAIKEHKVECADCGYSRGGCAKALEMQAELKAGREELKHWFDPPPDAATLL